MRAVESVYRAIANHQQLVEDEFYVALKLIALAQQDFACTPANLRKTGLKLPRFASA